MKISKRKLMIFILIATVVVIIYILSAYILLQFALVPSFMQKFEAFDRLSDKGMSEQVYTDDIVNQASETKSLKQEWLETVSCRKLAMMSDDNLRLIAVEFTQEDKDAPWVLLVHGYTGRKSDMYARAYYFYQKGYNILTPDLRAQGESEGKYIGMGYLDKPDLKKWISYIVREHPDSDIVLLGESMGASAVLELIEEELPRNVVCAVSDAGFRNPIELFKFKIKDWIGIPDFGLVDTANIFLKALGKYDLNDAAAIKAVGNAKRPVLLIHGTEDKIVPVDNVYSLYDACKAPYKDILVVEGAGHCQSCDKEHDTYYKRVFEFCELWMS